MHTLVVQHVPDSDPPAFTVMRHDPFKAAPETATITPPERFRAEGLEQTDLRRELRWYLEHFLDYLFSPNTERAGPCRAPGKGQRDRRNDRPD